MSGLLVGAVACAANVVVRQVSSAVALRRAAPAEQHTQTRPRKSMPLPNAYLVTFIAVVIVPSFLCSVYLALIASNQYVAEARVAVQSAQFGFGGAKTSGTLGTLSAGAIPALAGQDAYIITDYIHSRAIIDDLAGKIDIKTIFQRPEGDFWARLRTTSRPMS